MQYLNEIKELNVQSAIYRLEDKMGKHVTLYVDYAGNTFRFEQTKESIAEAFWQEARQFAQGLLARKHGVNLAKREQYV